MLVIKASRSTVRRRLGKATLARVSSTYNFLTPGLILLLPHFIFNQNDIFFNFHTQFNDLSQTNYSNIIAVPTGIKILDYYQQ